MKTTKIELTKLTPSEGMVLTNGETYSTEVYLGCNDSEDNWHEITDAEYETHLAEEKARMEAEIQNFGGGDNDHEVM